MKVIRLQHNDKYWIKKALKNDALAQKALYEKYSPKMLGVCRQYIKDVHFAEDVMVEGFVKVFKKLDGFRFQGSFEGWVRRIMVNECISYLRKKQFVVYDETVLERSPVKTLEAHEPWEVDFIQQHIDALPEGYKMVFLLHAIEGYRHEEIAKMLKISEGTSKSQLFKARRQLQDSLGLRGIDASKRGRS
ncbi:MAG: RNA polymerase sigma factor [Bacteroidota bacterium]